MRGFTTKPIVLRGLALSDSVQELITAATSKLHKAPIHNVMKKCLLFLTAVSMCLATGANAAISVGPTGSGTLTFDTLPAVADGWSSLSIGTVATTITTGAGLDSAVALLTAASISTAVGTTSTTAPAPSANALARWNSALLLLQTRPTGNDYTVLMATLQNNTLLNSTHLNINYDLNALVASGSTIVEEVPGHRVYYSLTGAAGSWVEIPALESPTPAFAGAMSASIDLAGTWTAGSTMYVLWADDNGSVSDTAPTREGSYTIDNVVFATAVVPPTAPAFANNTDPTNRTVLQCGSTTFSAGAATGNPAPTYQWYSNDVSHPIGGATSSAYTIASVQPVHAANYFVQANNILGTAESHHATLTVTPAPAFTLTHAIAPDYSVVSTMETTNRTVIRITFSEPVDAATVSAAGFTVKERSSATTVAVSSATVTNGTNIHIVTAARTADVNYDVILNAPGVGNTCVATKITGTFGVGLPVLLLDPDPTHMWRYNDSGNDPGAGWQNVGYVDTAWPQGLAPFDGKKVDPPRTEITNTPVRTALVLTNVAAFNFTNDLPTYNFRTHISVPGVPVALQAITFWDDGAALYINGTDSFRLRAPATANFAAYGGTGAITGEGSYEGPFDLPTVNVVSGDNVIAVELKQTNATSSDATMGLRLIGYYTTLGPRLTLSGPDFFGDYSLTWSSGTLQDSSSPAGPWHDVASAASPLTFNTTELGPGATKRFFRLR